MAKTSPCMGSLIVRLRIEHHDGDSVVSTEGRRPERRDLLSTISRLSWREGLSAPRFALRSRRRKSPHAIAYHNGGGQQVPTSCPSPPRGRARIPASHTPFDFPPATPQFTIPPTQNWCN